MRNNKTYYAMFFVLIGGLIGFVLFQFFYSPTIEPPQIEPIEKMIISQEEIRKEAKKAVEREVRKIHDQVKKEVDSLSDDELSVALNIELARFRKLSTDTERATSP